MPKHANTHPLDSGYLQIDNNDLQISELLSKTCPESVCASYDGHIYTTWTYFEKSLCKVHSWLVHTDRDTHKTVQKARNYLSRTMPAGCRYEIDGQIVDELRSIVSSTSNRGFVSSNDKRRVRAIYVYMATALVNIALYMGHNPINGDMTLSCGRLNVVVRF